MPPGLVFIVPGSVVLEDPGLSKSVYLLPVHIWLNRDQIMLGNDAVGTAVTT